MGMFNIGKGLLRGVFIIGAIIGAIVAVVVYLITLMF